MKYVSVIHYIKPSDIARLLRDLDGTVRHHEAPTPWNFNAELYQPDYTEYDTPHGMIKVVRYTVPAQRPIERGGIPHGVDVVIGCTTKAVTALNSLSYVWLSTTTPATKPIPIRPSAVEQLSLI